MHINIQSTKQTKLVKQDSCQQNLEWNTVYSDISAIQRGEKTQNTSAKIQAPEKTGGEGGNFIKNWSGLFGILKLTYVNFKFAISSLW